MLAHPTPVAHSFWYKVLIRPTSKLMPKIISLHRLLFQVSVTHNPLFSCKCLLIQLVFLARNGLKFAFLQFVNSPISFSSCKVGLTVLNMNCMYRSLSYIEIIASKVFSTDSFPAVSLFYKTLLRKRE